MTRAMLLAALAAFSGIAAAAVPDPVRARNLASSCAACHGTQGASVGEMPALAGTPRDEIVAKLKEFRAGSREATIMHRHAKGYDDRQIELLADYFSQQKR